ncbi:MAG: hypothetical protein ACD_2C00158G0001 [uncultured bacterium (gcode 4)]|uniref:Uncharacterized protein n=1 Tax=uncultured bacterium (gcode 4) TaxID=1234023 RepID=K2G2S7_9BACT|nr:MAG: hypothetical protein ACD_2C00158G0001 [uncultured bacterium (gcode 4)]
MNESILINRTRELSRDMWEGAIANLLWWSKRKISSWADLYLDDITNIEVKCRLYWQPVNILIWQLLSLSENDIYALLFYRTNSWKRPLSILKQMWRWGNCLDHFKKSVSISKIFLFPVPYINHFYETTHMKEVTISSTWVKHKWLAVKTATEIYENSNETKSIFETPIDFPASPLAITYAVGEKINRILRMKWHKER